jgi:hypothetical protein
MRNDAGLDALEIDKVRVSEVEARDVEWLWPGRVAIGKVSLVAGNPGLGKSLVTLDMAARVSRGWAWPGEEHRYEAEPGAGGRGQGEEASRANHRFAIRATGSVLLLSAEDDLSDTIRPRLEAAGADCERVVAIRAMVDPRGGGSYQCLELARDLQRLARELAAMPDCRLVVIDPLSAYLGQNIESTNAAVRRLLGPLWMLAAARRIAVVVVTHLRKRQGTALERAIGSVGFVAASRAAWLVARDPEHAERRLLVPMKNNLAEDRGGLAYTIVPRGERGSPMLVWHPEPVRLDADELVAVQKTVQVEKKNRADAVEWLQGYLLDGPRRASDVRDDAEQAGISYGTLRRAFAELGGKATALSDSVPRFWMWELPEEGAGR